MHTQLAAVDAFHKKMNVSPCMPWRFSTELNNIGEALLSHSQTLELSINDPVFLRAHLMIEELGEYLTATNELEALDALTDLLYVLLGTALTYQWPLTEAFNEVHRSNMTKVKQDDDPSKARVRKKGSEFVKPDLVKVMTEPVDDDSLDVVLSGYNDVLDLRQLTEGQKRDLRTLYLEMLECTQQ